MRLGKEDWGPLDSMLADNFTFTSAAGDHISKALSKHNAGRRKSISSGVLNWSGSQLSERMLL